MIARISRILQAGMVVVGFLAIVMLSTKAYPKDAAAQYVREERLVSVDGVTETWRLVWEGKPSAVCEPEDVISAITCPCAGLAYGEYGKLSLVRTRGGREIERMDLAPLFGKFDYPDAERLEGKAYLQRWPTQDSDLERSERDDPKLVSEIRRRMAPRIMQLADYDRDGKATEFLIQVGTLPCGKLQFSAVGISDKNPHLHALTSVARPDEPLVLPLSAWQVLLSHPEPTTVQTWDCGDHGSEVRTEVVVSASKGEIRVKEREYSCPEDGSPERLLQETDG